MIMTCSLCTLMTNVWLVSGIMKFASQSSQGFYLTHRFLCCDELTVAFWNISIHIYNFKGFIKLLSRLYFVIYASLQRIILFFNLYVTRASKTHKPTFICWCALNKWIVKYCDYYSYRSNEELMTITLF